MLLVANWKMNGDSTLLAQMHQALLAIKLAEGDVIICPPFTLLAAAQQLFADTAIAIGAQDVSSEENGAFTGQISAKMLSQLACSYVIIGHSERRQYCLETDTLIAAKCAQAQNAGLIPILCVGENAEQKARNETEQVVLAQVRSVLDNLQKDQLAQLVIAYEPVWAIGSGQAAAPELANNVHGMIRAAVAEYDVKAAAAMQILYGGSVNADNIAAFLAQPHINGALIGGASLKPDVFVQLIQKSE